MRHPIDSTIQGPWLSVSKVRNSLEARLKQVMDWIQHTMRGETAAPCARQRRRCLHTCLTIEQGGAWFSGHIQMDWLWVCSPETWIAIGYELHTASAGAETE